MEHRFLKIVNHLSFAAENNQEGRKPLFEGKVSALTTQKRREFDSSLVLNVLQSPLHPCRSVICINLHPDFSKLSPHSSSIKLRTFTQYNVEPIEFISILLKETCLDQIEESFLAQNPYISYPYTKYRY